MDDDPIAKHNSLRDRQGVPALSWNQSLQDYATEWSQKCVFDHSGGPYGENLALGYPSIAASVDGWYEEIKE